MSTRHDPTTFDQLNKISDAADGLLDAILTLIEESPSLDEALVNRARVGLPPEVGPRVMRAAVSSMGTDFSILSRAAVPER